MANYPVKHLDFGTGDIYDIPDSSIPPVFISIIGQSLQPNSGTITVQASNISYYTLNSNNKSVAITQSEAYSLVRTKYAKVYVYLGSSSTYKGNFSEAFVPKMFAGTNQNYDFYNVTARMFNFHSTNTNEALYTEVGINMNGYTNTTITVFGKITFATS